MTLITLAQADWRIDNAGTYQLNGVTTPYLELGGWFDSLEELIDSYAADYGMDDSELIDWLGDNDRICVVYDVESGKFTLLL